MDLSRIPWLFIYLLFMRDSLIYCTTRPYFLWLRLRYMKAHGDLGAPSLSYFKKTKSKLSTQVKYDGMFVHFVFVLREVFSRILCLGSLYVCYIHDLVFIWQCRVFKFMDMTNIIEVTTSALARTLVVRYFKKMISLNYI